MALAKNRNISQWDGMDRPETNFYVSGQLIFANADKPTQWLTIDF
jgi:hypothetical protein